MRLPTGRHLLSRFRSPTMTAYHTRWARCIFSDLWKSSASRRSAERVRSSSDISTCALRASATLTPTIPIRKPLLKTLSTIFSGQLRSVPRRSRSAAMHTSSEGMLHSPRTSRQNHWSQSKSLTARCPDIPTECSMTTARPSISARSDTNRYMCPTSAATEATISTSVPRIQSEASQCATALSPTE